MSVKTHDLLVALPHFPGHLSNLAAFALDIILDVLLKIASLNLTILMQRVEDDFLQC